MRIEDLKPAEGSRRGDRRVGRGVGSGLGKTSGKGHKGQKARSGGTKGAGFEGGQMPLQRRLPKRGFKNYPFSKEYAVINLKDLSKVEDLNVITPAVLREKGVVKDLKDGLKVLGHGEIKKSITVKAHAFSSAAQEKITAAGGKAEVI
ncbi:MAG: 50S ribosomal protein L15 [Deltaproteobacteria bacterium]|nr:50S ribosomal protein L15 [Deltaproteobacteria bacterium]MCL5422220.1 50S ribosomal protein L15 [Nitrospirota bacterium]